MLEVFTDPALLASLVSLTALEIILGIDNVVFIALVVQHLPPAQRARARMVGLGLALFMRIGLLFSIVWILGLKEPFLTLLGHSFSGKDLMMLGGGLFLIYKATASMHDEMSDDFKHEVKTLSGGFIKTIIQIIFIDFIFSFDSVITAVGITAHVMIIVIAMVIAMFVMLGASGYIADFIDRHPTIKMLALAFILMIGVLLMGEGIGIDVPKGYIYFGMAFSLGVEVLNIIAVGRKKKRKQSGAAATIAKE
jgi:predicted tellurium resistance membrane protein TerC